MSVSMTETAKESTKNMTKHEQLLQVLAGKHMLLIRWVNLRGQFLVADDSIMRSVAFAGEKIVNCLLTVNGTPH